jgi:hypothetical protein
MISFWHTSSLLATTYASFGSCEVRKIGVCVEQKINETVSLTLVKNERVFPIEMFDVEGGFELEVECCYPKAKGFYYRMRS